MGEQRKTLNSSPNGVSNPKIARKRTIFEGIACQNMCSFSRKYHLRDAFGPAKPVVLEAPCGLIISYAFKACGV